jgi:hypothetical protein
MCIFHRYIACNYQRILYSTARSDTKHIFMFPQAHKEFQGTFLLDGLSMQGGLFS